ncbi:MAG: hypothetical protein K9M80_02605 [Candidatus Marinimicrobia bacterium]|nr:hypothetical protein [Candidatus Neomarinimicrobiota bacterium]
MGTSANIEEYIEEQANEKDIRPDNWVDFLEYVSLLDRSTIIQIHKNIENGFYDDPLIFDIIVHAIIEQSFH